MVKIITFQDLSLTQSRFEEILQRKQLDQNEFERLDDQTQNKFNELDRDAMAFAINNSQFETSIIDEDELKKSPMYDQQYQDFFTFENRIQDVNLPWAAAKNVATGSYRELMKTVSGADSYIDNLAATPPRIEQVMTAVFENGDDYVDGVEIGVSDARGQNPNTHYNRALYKDPSHPGWDGSGLTIVGWLALAAWPILFVMNFAIKIYATHRKMEVDTYNYLKDRLLDIRKKYGQKITSNPLKQEVEMVGLDENISDKSPLEKTYDRLVHYTDKIKKRRSLEKYFIVEKIRRRKDSGKIAGTKRFFRNLISNFFKLSDDLTSRFWTSWMFVNILFGFELANSIYMPHILIGTAVTVGIFYAIKLVIYGVKKIREARKPPEKDKINPAFTELEQNEIVQEAKQRVYFQEDHKQIMKMLGVTNKTKVNKPIIPIKTKLGPLDENSEIYRKLKFSSNRLVVSLFLSFFNRLILTIFTVWLASSTAGVIPALAPVAAALTGPLSAPITVSIGILLGGIFAIKAGVHVAKDRTEHNVKLDQVLGTRYKKTNETKQQAFDRLFQEVETLKTKIIDQRKQLRELNKNDPTAAFNVKEIDVYNDYLFEKQKDKPSYWTYFKKGLKRLYAGPISGGQTGIFAARFFFLGTNLAILSATIGTVISPPVFLGIAIGLGVLFAGVNYIKYRMDTQLEHQRNFIGTFDSRLSYLNKKSKELKVVENILNDQLNKNENPQKETRVSIDESLKDGKKEIVRKISIIQSDGMESSVPVSSKQLQQQDAVNTKENAVKPSEIRNMVVIPEKVATVGLRKLGIFSRKIASSKLDENTAVATKTPGKTAAAA